MTREQHLLIHVMEECAEVAHRASKALRFGMEEVQSTHVLTNRERMISEFVDLVAVMEMVGVTLQAVNGRQMDEKIKKVDKYLAYAKECGTLD